MTKRESGYAIGDRVRVTIERIVAGGVGLGRGPAGVVLVEFAAPGDLLDIEIESNRGGAARGRIVSIVEGATSRIQPPCPWYGQCGGCDFQHLSYKTQLDAKEMILRDALERVGGISWTKDIARFATSEPFGGRARVELHTDPTTGAIGFFARRTNRVVDIASCMVSRPEIDRAITAVRSTELPLPASIHLFGSDGAVRGFPVVPPIDGGSLWLTVGAFDYLVDPQAFFQSSLDLLPTLVDFVMDSAGEKKKLAWDLFSGAGLFTLPLAAAFGRVSGVEVDPHVTRNAIMSAERNGVENARFVTEEVMRWLNYRRQRQAHPDLVVVDPPRAGLGHELARCLTEMQLPRLTYVSCDPATLARDLKILTSQNLRIADIAIFDLFPQTHHVETVARLIALPSVGRE